MSAARAAAFALAALLALGCRVEEGRDAAAPRPAPDFALPDLAGATVSLAELRGKPAVIDFWATWCTPCEFQIPVLNALHERHGERISVVGVAVDAGGREVVAPYAAEHRIRYRVLLGDEALAQRFGAIGFPTLFVLRADGTIDSTHVGIVDAEELEAAVEAALAPPTQRAGAG
ncbi:MAG TPA: TlpA disulfide reductase family protein [Myxococcota bacterium]|nr:TlpA disulfide reductase family protein [Myxococcota bacterium]